MTLRRKTWLIVGTALVGLPVIFFGVASTVLLRGFSRLEEQATTQNVERVLDALAKDLETLDQRAIDEGQWDDTYNFVLDRNPDYLVSNYPENGVTLLYQQLNLVMILDVQGNVLFAQQFDLESEEVVPVSNTFLAQFDPYMPLLNHTDLNGSASGIVPLGEGYLMMASRPILTSNFDGPSRGTMVMGRFLTEREIERFEALTNQPDITLKPFDSSQLPSDFQMAQQRLESKNQSPLIQPLGQNKIAGYALLDDITGEPLLVLRVVQSRDIYAQGQTSVWSLLLATVATAVFFGGITVILLERGVLLRLNQLSQEVNHIGATHDLATRVHLTGHDELTELATTVNWTLDQLEKVQQDLKQTSEKLAASNAELEQFAYVASHDLQAPLCKIEAFGTLLQTDYDASLNEVGQAHLQRIQNSARQMRGLIQDLLDLARVTTQTQPFTPVNLTDVAQAVVADLTPQIQDLDAQVTIESLPTVEAEPRQMRQLFQNVIGNGLKFHHPERSPQVTVTSQDEVIADSLTNNADGSVCHIAIVDNGIGFDEIYQERIFKMFQRLHTRDEYDGTGIGLAICAKIVKRHGGTITATSQPGQGATFTITLPIKQST